MTGAEKIAAALGGACRSGEWWRCRCPVHSSRGPTLALRNGKCGLIVKCFGGCDARDVLAEIRCRGLLNSGDERNNARPDPSEIAHHREAEARDRQRRIASALDLWRECFPAPDTIVERYLHSRKLTGAIPPTLRMHGMMRHRDSAGRRPAMVALVEHVERGPTGVHLTYLAIDGSMQATVEPRKRSLGPVGGAAVRLAHVEPDRELVIAEGIETTASVMQATGLPGWAALSANGIRSLILPPAARKVLIAADNDANGVGERAAIEAAGRWLSEGRRVRLALPQMVGTDWADVLTGRDEEVHRAVA
jgi:hypothetical protein